MSLWSHGNDFLGRTITTAGVKPQKENVQKFLAKISEMKKTSNGTFVSLSFREITSQDYRKHWHHFFNYLKRMTKYWSPQRTNTTIQCHQQGFRPML